MKSAVTIADDPRRIRATIRSQMAARMRVGVSAVGVLPFADSQVPMIGCTRGDQVLFQSVHLL
jgi:hypothetical protein